MKKIITSIAALFITANIYSQNIDTVSVSLTIPAQGWAWAIGEYGEGNDSLTRKKVRDIRTSIIAANPVNWATNVQINNVPGKIVLAIYRIFCHAPFNIVIQMGSNNVERTVIYNNIRAINNSALQYFITQIDEYYLSDFINTRSKGKTIIIDN